MKPIEDFSVYGAWVQAARYLSEMEQERAYNLILEIQSPMTFRDGDKCVREAVNAFLIEHGKQSLDTVAGTILPLGLYQRYGSEGVYSKYPEIVYPRILKSSGNDWGRYAYRLVRVQSGDRQKDVLLDKSTGEPVNPLRKLVAKLSNYKNDPKKAAYEASLIDPVQDIPIYRPSHDRLYTMGGPCLSHLSFKVTDEGTLALTAFYRNHFYVERALGNFIGLSWLLYFVATETGFPAGTLTCISSMAQLETGPWRKGDIASLISDCDRHSSALCGDEIPVVWERAVGAAGKRL